MARHIFAFHGAPDRTLHHRVFLRLARGRVFALNPSTVVEVGVALADKLPTVLRRKEERPTLVVHVGDERLDLLCGLRRPCHPVRSHPP